jgi:hypothetical protein
MNSVLAKVCFKCNVEKPLTEFYPHPRMADGHLNKCKECTKRDAKSRYDDKPDTISAYEKRRANTPHRKAKLQEYQQRRRTKYPERFKARNAVNNALRDGNLARQPCEICGSTFDVEAHHDDYSKPLEVRWLCFKHHRGSEHGYRILSR